MPLRHVLLRRELDGSWSARCPSLPGCTAHGRTRDEALERVRQEIQDSTRSMQAAGLPVPPDDYETETLRV
jgi:predicted RNase H-like HicB family nuclease